MDPEDMMLRETIQAQKDISGTLTHMRSLEAVRIREQVGWVSKGWEESGEELLFGGRGLHFADAKRHGDGRWRLAQQRALPGGPVARMWCFQGWSLIPGQETAPASPVVWPKNK